MPFHVRVIAESPAERASRDLNGPSEGGEMRRLRDVPDPYIQPRMPTATDVKGTINAEQMLDTDDRPTRVENCHQV